MKNKVSTAFAILLILAIPVTQGCISYSFTGAATTAKTIQVDDFFNNTDLGPANLGQTFTNKLKQYYQQNSSLRVVTENGELQIEGTITQYLLTPIAPVSAASGTDAASLTRLTIDVRANYVDTIEAKNNFKDRVFTFYADFPSEQDFNSIQESLERKILDQIYIDIFNATLANW